MNSKVFSSSCLLVLAGWFAFSPQLSRGSDIRRISGSYQVVQQVKSGSQTQVRLRIRLLNRGDRDLTIQRLALWDFSHPSRAGMRACSLLLRPGTSGDTTQEFTIPRSEYESWHRGKGPRLALEVPLPSGRTTTEVVQLNAASSRKAD